MADQRPVSITPDRQCPECNGALRTERGETCCGECGLVLDEYRLDHGPGRPVLFEDGRSTERTGAPLTPARHDRGLSTEIGWGRDGTGSPLSAAERWRYGRLRREHTRARWRSRAERNLTTGLSEVTRIAAALDLPRSVRDRAATVFRDAHGRGLALGRTIEGIAAASVYAACRCLGVLRTAGEVVAVSHADEGGLRHDYGVLNVALGLSTPAYAPALYLGRFASDLDVGDTLRERALSLLRGAIAAGLDNGRRPAGVAAACLYEAARRCGDRLTQAEIAAVADVSPTTLRARWRELETIDTGPLAGG